jgi:serine protease
VTGITALWLSYDGRDKIIERYRAEKLPFIFNQVLCDTCKGFDWSEGEFGAGIVNAERVLLLSLPDGVHRLLLPPTFGLQGHAPIDSWGLETFEHQFSNSLTVEGTTTQLPLERRARVSL